MLQKDNCRSTIYTFADAAIPGLIACGNFPSKNRTDGRCSIHGKRADKNAPPNDAREHAPTLSKIHYHWSQTTAAQKRAAYRQSADRFPDLGSASHQTMSQLFAWYQANANALPPELKGTRDKNQPRR